MDTAPAFASISEAIDMARAALGYLAAADVAQLADATLAEALRGLEQTDAISTAVRAYFLSAFTSGQGYAGDADYSPRAWLMHKTRVSRGAAVAHTAWAKRAGTHPAVVAALAARGAVGVLRPDDLHLDRQLGLAGRAGRRGRTAGSRLRPRPGRRAKQSRPGRWSADRAS
jgi:hypothetical protein